MGEKQNHPFQLSFNASLKIDFQGLRVTFDDGLILVRELDERLRLGDFIAQHLTDSRRGKNTQHPLVDLLYKSVYSRIAGYEDVNDAERLSQDPSFRLIGSEKIWERGAALTTRLQSFETELLTQAGNLAGLASINRKLIVKAEAIEPQRGVVLDMDSAEIPVYAQQEQNVKYAIRIPANDSLERNIPGLLRLPVGRPSHESVVWYKSFLYKAESWKTARRVVAKLEFHLGELFHRVGFIVTNLGMDSRAVVRFYNKRGTAEQ